MRVGNSVAIQHCPPLGVGAGAQHAALRFLEAEARTLAFPVTAVLIGAAADALGEAAEVRMPRDSGRIRRLVAGDPTLALARCLALVRGELKDLADPTPRRFVDAAILSLAEPLPGAGSAQPDAEAAFRRRH